MPKTVGLTAKEERFVPEYLVDGNATRAAIAAGYSERTAAKIGSELLTRPRVRAAINAGKRRIAAKLDLSAEKVLRDIDRISTKAEKARDFYPALKGRELIGKHLKLFTEKHEHGGIGGGPVALQITDRETEL